MACGSSDHGHFMPFKAIGARKYNMTTLTTCQHRPLAFQAHAIRRQRTDPSRTTVLRARFEAALVRRFKRLRREVIQSIVDNDGFGLRAQDFSAQQAAPQRAFAFPRSGDKVAAFMRWLRQQESSGILEIRQGTTVEAAAQRAWINLYIDTAYQRGIRTAGQKMRKAGADVSERWIDAAFNRPVHADRLGLIYTRTFSELEGITKTMDQQISRVLSLGIGEGRGPMDIARQIVDRVDKIGITRARTLARTEIISAHADATLNSYEEAGIEGVKLEAEFSTAGDNDVCPECEALEGNIYSIAESRGIIPVHPNCRCAWLPVVADARGVRLE